MIKVEFEIGILWINIGVELKCSSLSHVFNAGACQKICFQDNILIFKKISFMNKNEKNKESL